MINHKTIIQLSEMSKELIEDILINELSEKLRLAQEETKKYQKMWESENKALYAMTCERELQFDVDTIDSEKVRRLRSKNKMFLIETIIALQEKLKKYPDDVRETVDKVVWLEEKNDSLRKEVEALRKSSISNREHHHNAMVEMHKANKEAFQKIKELQSK